MRPSSLRRLRSASHTADHSTSPIKRKTDDCTPLQSSASLISSAPHRHQTCSAEYPKHPTSRTSPLSRLHTGGIFISVPASPLSQRRERSAGKPPPFMMAFSHCQMSLRPTPPTPPNHWSAPAPPLAAPAPRISLIPPETACPAATQIRCRSVSRTVQEKPSPDRNKSVPERRAVSSYSFETAPGKPCADSPSDVRQPAPQSATHSGWSERGRCALPSASSPLPSSPQAACTAAPRASGQCPAPYSH